MPHPLTIHGRHFLCKDFAPDNVDFAVEVIDAWSDGEAGAWALCRWPCDTNDVLTATRIGYSVVELDALERQAAAHSSDLQPLLDRDAKLARLRVAISEATGFEVGNAASDSELDEALTALGQRAREVARLARESRAHNTCSCNCAERANALLMAALDLAEVLA